ncbi:unnamed protein product [Heligmosomoides polygyrus]|uniref:F-type ATPase subunit delta n=1 Tax=Heligmosomoides polygyrus TaxID=6339 RepID=A0A3P8ASX8_HELPZ|nr:unnamed protein product [Heligmosomoides polygyrus]
MVVKNIIKLAVKLGLLARNDMLDKEDLRQLNDVQKQLHSLSLTIISFVQVKYSFERTHLIELLKQLQHSLAPLVSFRTSTADEVLSPHVLRFLKLPESKVSLKLSDKSTRRLEHVIVHLSSTDFLDGLFKVDGPHAGVLSQFVDSLEGLLDAEGL